MALVSAPALAAALRRVQRHQELATPMRTLLRHSPLVPLYRVGSGEALQSIADEANAAAQMLVAVTERLRRLRAAYGAWDVFDAGAYFDLTPPQTARLVQISERVTTVHLLFFADALLPSFQRAEAYWQEVYRPHYEAMQAALGSGDGVPQPVFAFGDAVQPTMLEQWQRLNRVIQATRSHLSDELGFWTANGSSDERARWRWAWDQPASVGVAEGLLPRLAHTPTLTLAVDFPLPAFRQPGRRRRLALRRERGPQRSRSG
jgi:hypothetical protein